MLPVTNIEALPVTLMARIWPYWVTGCWIFIGHWNSGNGYGKVGYEGKTFMVHRLVYELLVGPIPEGLVLDHACRIRSCCNPSHLEPVTVLENTLRGEAVLFGDDGR